MRKLLLNMLTGPNGDHRVANHLAVWGGSIGVVAWVISWVLFEWKGTRIPDEAFTSYATMLSSLVLTVGAAEAGADFTANRRQGDQQGAGNG